jgi:hypothetical protein
VVTVTTHDDPNDVLRQLVAGVREALGGTFVGAYLQGSLAVGDFDDHSDVDFIVAVDDELSAAQVSALQAVHGRIYDLPSHWAKHLEGSYFPLATLRRCPPPTAPAAPLWYLDNGSRQLVRSDHCNTAVVRWVVREHGIALAGPDPASLIDPVSADDLRREVRATMRRWAAMIFGDPGEMTSRWYQSFAALGYARMLQTLETGTIESKPAAVRWARSALEPRWAGLVQRACDDRPDPSQKVHQPADPAELEETRAFIRHALDAAGR